MQWLHRRPKSIPFCVDGCMSWIKTTVRGSAYNAHHMTLCQHTPFDLQHSAHRRFSVPVVSSFHFILSQFFKPQTDCPFPPSKLYTKGYIRPRAKRNATCSNTSLIQIEGITTKEDAQLYLGKRIAYVYYAKREIHGSKVQ
jgi:hypothetical protein